MPKKSPAGPNPARTLNRRKGTLLLLTNKGPEHKAHLGRRGHARQDERRSAEIPLSIEVLDRLPGRLAILGRCRPRRAARRSVLVLQFLCPVPVRIRGP